MCCLPGFLRMTLPEPVTWYRLAAACDQIIGGTYRCCCALLAVSTLHGLHLTLRTAPCANNRDPTSYHPIRGRDLTGLLPDSMSGCPCNMSPATRRPPSASSACSRRRPRTLPARAESAHDTQPGLQCRGCGRAMQASGCFRVRKGPSAVHLHSTRLVVGGLAPTCCGRGAAVSFGAAHMPLLFEQSFCACRSQLGLYKAAWIHCIACDWHSMRVTSRCAEVWAKIRKQGHASGETPQRP